MPRRSPFVIRLTEQERAELEARCKEYTSPDRDAGRSRIVLLASEGLGNDRIAAQLGMPRQIASKWRRRFWTRSAARSRRSARAADDRRTFPPNVVVAIKALACELPSRHGLPLARWSIAELRQEAVACGIPGSRVTWGLTILGNAPNAANAVKFLQTLFGSQGVALQAAVGPEPISPPRVSFPDWREIPPALRPYVRPEHQRH